MQVHGSGANPLRCGAGAAGGGAVDRRSEPPPRPPASQVHHLRREPVPARRHRHHGSSATRAVLRWWPRLHHHRGGTGQPLCRAWCPPASAPVAGDCVGYDARPRSSADGVVPARPLVATGWGEANLPVRGAGSQPALEDGRTTSLVAATTPCPFTAVLDWPADPRPDPPERTGLPPGPSLGVRSWLRFGPGSSGPSEAVVPPLNRPLHLLVDVLAPRVVPARLRSRRLRPRTVRVRRRGHRPRSLVTQQFHRQVPLPEPDREVVDRPFQNGTHRSTRRRSASARPAIPSTRISLTSRSCAVPKLRSTRPLV